MSPGEYQLCWHHGDCSSARWHWTYSITSQKVNTSLKSGSAKAYFHESLLCDVVDVNICAWNGYEVVEMIMSLWMALFYSWEFWFMRKVTSEIHSKSQLCFLDRNAIEKGTTNRDSCLKQTFNCVHNWFYFHKMANFGFGHFGFYPLELIVAPVLCKGPNQGPHDVWLRTYGFCLCVCEV